MVNSYISVILFSLSICSMQQLTTVKIIYIYIYIYIYILIRTVEEYCECPGYIMIHQVY